jgi:presenilin-like A22 family membrane protease
VLSPQYLVWIFGVLAVCAFNPPPNFKRIFILISISSVLGQLIYPGWYISFQLGGALAVGAHAIRVITLVWATVLVWRNVSEHARNSKQEAVA